MDNEKPIEKLLRRYAKKRSEDSGAPMEMHPATRRLLQGEVARQFKEGRDKGENAGSSWWLRWAIIFGASAAVLVVAAVVLPRHATKSTEFEMAAVKNEAIRPRDKLEMAENANSSARAKVPGTTSGLAGSANEFDEKKDAGVPASILARSDVAVSSADLVLLRKETERVDSTRERLGPIPSQPGGRRQEEGAVVAAKPDESSTREARLMTPPATTPTASVAIQSPKGITAQVEQQEALFSNAGTVADGNNVLVSFKVQQLGDDLRVTDSDGSTYAGKLVTVANQTPAEKDYLKQKVEENARTRQAIGSANFELADAVQNSSFRVSGLNNTLKQQVVFTGNILATNAVSLQNQSSLRNNQNSFNQQIYRVQLSNSVIVGRAQIEKASAIEVNAVPVTR